MQRGDLLETSRAAALQEMKSNNKALRKKQEGSWMTTENVLMYVPRSAACCKKFYDESPGLREQCFWNVVRTYEMLQEKQGNRNKTKHKLLRRVGVRRDRSSYSYCYFLTANPVKIACFETAYI